MRCVDCTKFKETIPEQLRYVYCTAHEKEVPVWVENMEETCEYAELRIGATVHEISER